MQGRCIAGVVVALSIASAPAFGQSLAELARQEEARRAAAPKVKKTYSNANLSPGGIRDVAPATAEGGCDESTSEGQCVEIAPMEAPIRREAETVRGELARVQREIDELVAQSDNAALPEAKRRLSAEQIVLKSPALAGFQRRWARLERQVKDGKLPHVWIEPVPANALPQQ
jgi:hypothetical protein